MELAADTAGLIQASIVKLASKVKELLSGSVDESPAPSK